MLNIHGAKREKKEALGVARGASGFTLFPKLKPPRCVNCPSVPLRDPLMSFYCTVCAAQTNEKKKPPLSLFVKIEFYVSVTIYKLNKTENFALVWMRKHTK